MGQSCCCSSRCGKSHLTRAHQEALQTRDLLNELTKKGPKVGPEQQQENTLLCPRGARPRSLSHGGPANPGPKPEHHPRHTNGSIPQVPSTHHLYAGRREKRQVRAGCTSSGLGGACDHQAKGVRTQQQHRSTMHTGPAQDTTSSDEHTRTDTRTPHPKQSHARSRTALARRYREYIQQPRCAPETATGSCTAQAASPAPQFWGAGTHISKTEGRGPHSLLSHLLLDVHSTLPRCSLTLLRALSRNSSPPLSLSV